MDESAAEGQARSPTTPKFAPTDHLPPPGYHWPHRSAANQARRLSRAGADRAAGGRAHLRRAEVGRAAAGRAHLRRAEAGALPVRTLPQLGAGTGAGYRPEALRLRRLPQAGVDTAAVCGPGAPRLQRLPRAEAGRAVVCMALRRRAGVDRAAACRPEALDAHTGPSGPAESTAKERSPPKLDTPGPEHRAEAAPETRRYSCSPPQVKAVATPPGRQPAPFHDEDSRFSLRPGAD